MTDYQRCLGKCGRALKAHQLENGYCQFCQPKPDPFMPKNLSPYFQRLEKEWNQ